MLPINLFYYTTVLLCSNNLYTSETVTNIAKDQREKRNFLVQHSTWSEMLLNCKDDQFCNELDQLQIHAIKTPQYSTFIEEFEKTIRMDKLKSIMNQLTNDLLLQKQALYADINLKEYITIADQYMFRSLVLNLLLTMFEQMNIYNEKVECELYSACQYLPLDKSCKTADEIKTYNDELLKVIIKLYEMYLVFLDNFDTMYTQLKVAYKSLEDNQQLAYTYQDSLFVNKINLLFIYTNIDFLATQISHYKCEHIQNSHDSYSNSQFDAKNFLNTQLLSFTRKASVLNSFVKLVKDHLDAFVVTIELDDLLITIFLEFEMAFISVFLKDLSCFNFKINTSTESAELTNLVDQTKLKEFHDSINAIGTGICQLTLHLLIAYSQQKK